MANTTSRKTVTFAKIINDAIASLAVDAKNASRANKHTYTCVALRNAARYNNVSFTNVEQELSKYGVRTNSFREFGGFKTSHERQAARFLWLNMLKEVAGNKRFNRR